MASFTDGYITGDRGVSYKSGSTDFPASTRPGTM